MPPSHHHPTLLARRSAQAAAARTSAPSLALACVGVATMLGACDQQTAARSPPGDLKLCNTTASRVGVAIGYQDSTGWTTEGWWNISAQTCETLYKGTLSSRFYYVH